MEGQRSVTNLKKSGFTFWEHKATVGMDMGQGCKGRQEQESKGFLCNTILKKVNFIPQATGKCQKSLSRRITWAELHFQ